MTKPTDQQPLCGALSTHEGYYGSCVYKKDHEGAHTWEK